MTSAELAEVLDLLGRAPRPPSEPAPTGATAAELEEVERVVGSPLPASLRAWLSVCLGSLAGPGGLFGAGTGPGSIAEILDIHPDWRSRRWIPVASDGCGNFYVLDADSDAVGFVDTMASVDTFDYVVASSLVRFLHFLLDRELGARGWPFDRDCVLARDPDLAGVSTPAPLPWNT